MTDDTGHDTAALPVTVRWSAARAARETGAARSTILNALQSGRLEGSKDADGAWQITPQALAVAGFRPGKPTPPDPAPVLEVDRDNDTARLRLELAEARADARVAIAEREGERALRESVERERDVYRLMLEQGKRSPAPPESTVTPSQSERDRTPTPAPTGPRTGKLKRAWNVVRYG